MTERCKDKKKMDQTRLDITILMTEGCQNPPPKKGSYKIGYNNIDHKKMPR